MFNAVRLYFNRSKLSGPTRQAHQTRPMGEATGRALVLGGTSALLLSLGALNGAAVSSSVFDPLKTFIASQLGSTLVIALAFIALIALVWQLSHGGGWKAAATVLGVLVAGLLGPGLVTASATATRSQAEVVAADAMVASAQHLSGAGMVSLILSSSNAAR